MKRLIVGIIVVLAFMLVPTSHAQAAHITTLTWVASPTTGATYNVYKQPACTGTFVKLNTTAVTVLTFVDSGMADGEVNCYLITAVLGAAESNQANSQTIKCTTPITPSVTPGAAVVIGPGGLNSKVS